MRTPPEASSTRLCARVPETIRGAIGAWLRAGGHPALDEHVFMLPDVSRGIALTTGPDDGAAGTGYVRLHDFPRSGRARTGVNPFRAGPVVLDVRMLRCDDAEITALALRAGAGERAAAEDFVRATQADVWRFVAHLAADVRLADDLTQETYLRALASLPRFEARSPARAWLLTIARRVVVDYIRSVQVRPRLHHSAEVPELVEPGFADRVALDDVIGTLEPERRTAFVLTQQLGLSYADAAEVCGCPVGTIRSRLARAREDLVTLLTDDHSGRRIS